MLLSLHLSGILLMLVLVHLMMLLLLKRHGISRLTRSGERVARRRSRVITLCLPEARDLLLRYWDMERSGRAAAVGHRLDAVSIWCLPWRHEWHLGI